MSTAACRLPPAACRLPPPARRTRLRLLPLSIEPRFQVVLACFLATMTAYVERIGFSIAFTAMAKEVGAQGGFDGGGGGGRVERRRRYPLGLKLSFLHSDDSFLRNAPSSSPSPLNAV